MRRPPYYRSTYISRTAQKYKHNMLRHEVVPTGDGEQKGYEHVATGPRLHDYYEVARIVQSLHTISEKIDFVNPYERDWSRFEKRWHREWLSKLNKPRRAWAIPLIPRYFDTQVFYQYITKTRVVDDSEKFDDIYKSIVLPTASFEKRVLESLRVMLQEVSSETEKERVSRFLRSLLDDAQTSLAHNREELRHQRVTHTARCETFWVRAGFLDSLYESRPVWLPENMDTDPAHRSQISRYIGDDIRKLGELSFTMRDQHVAHVRSTERLKLLFPASDTEQMEAPLYETDVFDPAIDKLTKILYSPRLYNLWPDEDILWQCPGYEPDSGETHMFGRFALKEVCDMRDQCVQWGIDASTDEGEEELAETRREMYTSTAITSLFTWLNGQAHCLGHTQYTDLNEPLVSQLVLSDGKEFFFAVGQLNTIAINIDVPG
ncbi:Ribosomal protein L37/S30 [Aphelenchoides avenae]|nr:Ribosomal protein L37/S30 [Aphelenchus avenae]